MTICISRLYGAAGGEMARAVAAHLGYRVLDHELPVVVAARLGTSADVVSGATDRHPTLGERLLAGIANTVMPEAGAPAPPPDAGLDADVKREIVRLVREADAAGEVVIVGRAASAILGPRANVLRVLAVAPVPWRVAHVAESLGYKPERAIEEVHRVDEARRAYYESFGPAWTDATSYDLTVDASRLGVGGAVETVVAAARALERAR